MMDSPQNSELITLNFISFDLLVYSLDLIP